MIPFPSNQCPFPKKQKIILLFKKNHLKKSYATKTLAFLNTVFLNCSNQQQISIPLPKEEMPDSANRIPKQFSKAFDTIDIDLVFYKKDLHLALNGH
jgi:hypothetical protein